MAINYFAVLKEKNIHLTVIGRGNESALNFERETGIKPYSGGLNQYLEIHSFPKKSYVIIATGTEALMPLLLLVLEAGAYKVLVEKPAAISIKELVENERKLSKYVTNVFVAYNRRFYSSVIETLKMIEEDGGLLTMHFEFTEWAHTIEPLTKAPGVKENWFFANSTHVIDLAFYLAGIPTKWQGYSKGGDLLWHSKTNYTGAGITDKGVLFSYLSNWESAGRWGLELLTSKRRIYLKPIESLCIQLKGELEVKELVFDNSIDLKYKPGLYRQLESFLSNQHFGLLNVIDHINLSKEIYKKMVDHN